MGVNSPIWMVESLHWLLFARQELLLFSVVFLLIGACDEIVMDLAWLWLRLRGKAQSGRVPEGLATEPLAGPAAVFVPAWQEAAVIGATIAHTLGAWVQRDYALYVGCYRNDPATQAAASAAANGDPRVRVVTIPVDGPSTKADCLNHLYAALCADEAASGTAYRSVVLQDAEDMVHPAGLAVIDRALSEADFVQLPVRPQLDPSSRWIAGHYADEFCEAHAKELVVRDAFAAAIPAAGVGCGFARPVLADMVANRRRKDEGGPFAADSLTEDYELGLLVTRLGGRGRFVRLRDEVGDLVATRCYFPDSFTPAVRQKSRWIHGIAFQGWDRLGWSRRRVDNWMALRDRRAPLTTLVLTAAYLLILVEGLIGLARLAGYPAALPLKPGVAWMVWFCGLALAWRAVFRLAFVGKEYGWAEGFRAVLRMPIANFIAIFAGRKAIAAYLRNLCGARIVWDKTEHRLHPAMAAESAR